MWMNPTIRKMKTVCILLLLLLANGCNGRMAVTVSESGKTVGNAQVSETQLKSEREKAGSNMQVSETQLKVEREKSGKALKNTEGETRNCNKAEQKKNYGYGNGDAFLQKYAGNDSVRQVILVAQSAGTVSSGRLFLLIKDEENEWKEIVNCKAILGKNGIHKTKEGDARTPTGDYGFIMAFGAKDDPGSLIPYTKLTDTMYLCGDKEYYNRFIDVSRVAHRCSHNSEHLIRYIPQYNYALFLDYNKERVYGKGSAIFLHCFGSYPYTLGCVSVAEENMVKIVRTVDINARICIYAAS